MPGKKVRDYLDQGNVKYVNIYHSPAYTAQEIAQSAHIAGKEMVKSVIVMADEKPLMVVVSALERVDIERIREITGAQNVRLASESEFRDLFPDCELGGMPPLGRLYEMDTLVSSRLEEDDLISFNAGSHRELIRMNYKDYIHLEQPQVVELG